MSNRLRELSDQIRALEDKLREAGGAKKIEKLHKEGKLTARERVELLRDPGSSMLEIGLLVAYDQYKGQAPAAGVVTAIVRVHGRETVVVANDPTVKAGSWWPETIKKILRAQEIAMRCRIPIVYLVDSAGVNLPYQGGVFPGQYGAARIFYYNSIMRRYLRIPFWAAKLDANRARDARNRQALEADGWTVLVIWECETGREEVLRQRLTEGLAGRPSPAGARPTGRDSRPERAAARHRQDRRTPARTRTSAGCLREPRAAACRDSAGRSQRRPQSAPRTPPARRRALRTRCPSHQRSKRDPWLQLPRALSATRSLQSSLRPRAAVRRPRAAPPRLRPPGPTGA